MKTVGIFGDSHGDCSYLDWKSRYKSIGLGWPELLALKYKVKNLAAAGSAIFYSYNLFKQMHSKFDIIVYVPTQADRFSVFCPDEGRTRHMVPGFLLSQAAQELENNKHNPNDYKAIEAAIGYSSYILNQEKEKEMKRLMLQEIKRLRPDTIFLPAFKDDLIDNTVINIGYLSVLEFHHYNTTAAELRAHKPPLMDVRKCHLTDGNNRVIFNKVLSAIESNETYVRLYDSDFVAPRNDFSKYFVNDNGRTNI
jgi:hypothetical protein